MKSIFRIIFMLLALNLISCSSKISKTGASDCETAQELVAQNRNDEAIELLSQNMLENDRDMRTRLLLATAYAGRAGIYVSDFTDFAEQIARSSKEVDELMSRRGGLFAQMKNKGANEAKIVVAFEKLMAATLRIDGLLRGFNYLPVVKNHEQRQDLKKAIELLAAEPRYRGGPALYRALLRISYFKYDLKNRYDFSSIQRCSINVNKLSRQIENLRQDVFEILNDIGFGMLDEKRQVKIEEFIGKLNNDMRLAVTALDRLADGAVDVSMIVRQLDGGCHE